MNNSHRRSWILPALLGLATLVSASGCHDETPAVDALKAMQVLVVKDSSGNAASVNNLPSDPAKLDEAMALVPSLQGLTSFTAFGTIPMKDEHLAYVGKMKKLTNVDLNGLPITDVGVGHLAGLSKIASLNLAATKITNESMKVIGGMPNLSTLNIAETSIDSGYEHLANCEKLEWLVVSDLKIPDASAEAIAQIPNLGRVSLQRAEISPAGLAAIRAKGDVTIDEGGQQQSGLGGEVAAPAGGQ